MYNPLSGCSALLHLLLKHPVLVVGLGLAGALSALSDNSENIQVPKDLVVHEKNFSEFIPALVISAEQAKKIKFILDDLQANGNENNAQSNVDGSLEIPIAEVNDSVKRVSERWFEAIKIAESNNEPIGVHPDGVSFGPAGLTENALKDVVPDCRTLGYDEVLNDPEASTKFAYIYFLDLIYEFQDVEVAVIACNNGKTVVKKWQKNGQTLPSEYLEKVRSNLK